MKDEFVAVLLDDQKMDIAVPIVANSRDIKQNDVVICGKTIERPAAKRLKTTTEAQKIHSSWA